MREYEFELSVGDVIEMGEYTMTVIDIDGEEVSFRLDSPFDEDPAVCDEPSLARSRS